MSDEDCVVEFEVTASRIAGLPVRRPTWQQIGCGKNAGGMRYASSMHLYFL
jgi:hypothetical protein